MWDGWCCIAVVVVMFLTSLPARGQNLLKNPSFEQVEIRDGQSKPQGWETWAYDGTVLSWVADQGRGGSGAGGVEVAVPGAAEFPLFCQRFDVQEGERYRARIWARTEDVVSSWGPQLNFEFQDVAGRRLPYVEGGQAGGGTHDWVELTNECYVPNSAVRMLFTAFTHREGKVWFDDAELVQVSAAESFSGTHVDIRVQADETVNGDFLGFGNHGDWLLGLDMNARRGVTEADRQLLRSRVAAMRPKIMRLLFDYKWWEPSQGTHSTDSPALQDMMVWIEFLQSIHCDVIIHPWGDYFAYSQWMLPDGDQDWWTNKNSRLPIPAQREAMVRSLADFLQFLHREKHLANVRYVCLMNEPENDHRRPTPVAEYVRLSRLLAECLKDRNLDQKIMLLGPDDCTGQYNGASLWWRQTVPETIDSLGGFSSHTYKHRDTRMLATWVQDRLGQARQLDPQGTARPLLVTEFGYVGLDGGTFDNPENQSYEYGLFMGDFAIEILNSGASAALMWCLFDQFYDDVHCQHYGLWEFKDQDWRPRPAYYSWSLINRFTEAHSRVVRVTATPAAERLRAAAMVSPRGEWTLMVVNRYDCDMQMTLWPGLPRDAEFRVFCYTAAALQAATGEMFQPSGTVHAAPQGTIDLTIPAQSFALLTELPDQRDEPSSW